MENSSSKWIFFLRSILWAIFLLICSCAHIENPPGGPEDKSRPFVKGVFPPPGSTNQPRDLKVYLQFSEWVKDDLYKNKVFISPALPQKLKFDFKGDEVRIGSGSQLAENTTYILSVTNTLSDLHNHNLVQPFELIFSTGPSLDSGKLKGTISGIDKRSAYIGLYPIEKRKQLIHLIDPDGKTPDSLPNPFLERPMYLIRSDSTGQFNYPGIKPGNYSILVFEDLSGNLKPEIGVERLGIGSPIFYVGNKIQSVQYTLAKFDTLKLVTGVAKWIGEGIDTSKNLAQGVVSIKWSERNKFVETLSLHQFYLTSKDSTDTLKATSLATNPTTLETEIQFPAVKIHSGYDVFIIPSVAKEDSVQNLGIKLGAVEIDKSHDTLSHNILPLSVKGKDTAWTMDQGLVFYSSKSFSIDEIKSFYKNLFIVITDSLNPDTLTYTLKQENYRTFSVDFVGKSPGEGQELKIWWQETQNVSKDSAMDTLSQLVSDSTEDTTFIKVMGEDQVVPKPTKPESIKDSALPASDTINSEQMSKPKLLAHLILARKEMFSSIKVKRKNSQGLWQYKIKSFAENKGELWRRNISKSSIIPEVVMDSILPGNYFLEYYQDQNNNGVWDKGGFNPWRQQEPLIVRPDSIFVKGGEILEIEIP